IRAFLEHCLLAPARAPDNLVDAIHVYLGQSGLDAPAPGAGGRRPPPGHCLVRFPSPTG
ncbi:hypothetical protein I5K80_12800, partial [Pseudomonas aeruginosa]|nr:hypothetical protein [Pseudomonas aeruginosa]